MNLYDPLLERDEAGIRKAIGEFRRSHTSDELFSTVARFAVLAYHPSQHGKHAMICCLSAHEAREQLGDRFDDVLTECAIYAAASRQPWSEPPITNPPPFDPDHPGDLSDLQSGERWLARRQSDPAFAHDFFRAAADDFEDLGHKLIVAVTAWKLAEIFGEQGRYATLRTAVWEMTAYRGESYVEKGGSIDDAAVVEAMIASGGDIFSAHSVFLLDAALQTGDAEVIRRVRDYLSGGAPSPAVRLAAAEDSGPPRFQPYRLARDYGSYLKSLCVAKRLGDERIAAAARYNLEHAPSFEEFSLA